LILTDYGGGFMQPEQNIFKLHAPFEPTGDQPQAIDALVKGFKEFFPENAVEYFVS